MAAGPYTTLFVIYVSTVLVGPLPVTVTVWTADMHLTEFPKSSQHYELSLIAPGVAAVPAVMVPS